MRVIQDPAYPVIVGVRTADIITTSREDTGMLYGLTSPILENDWQALDLSTRQIVGQ